MFSIKKKAAQTAKRAGFLTGGFILLAVGTGFLTLAAWFRLLVSYTPAQSALIIAAAYIGVGLVLIGFGQKRAHDRYSVEETEGTMQPSTSAPPLVQAFLHGIQAGTKAGNTKR